MAASAEIRPEANTSAPPDFIDTFVSFVLGLSDDQSVATVEAALQARATDVGIAIPPSIPSLSKVHAPVDRPLLAELERSSEPGMSCSSPSSSNSSLEVRGSLDRSSVALSTSQPSHRRDSFTSQSSISHVSVLSQPLPTTLRPRPNKHLRTLSFPRIVPRSDIYSPGDYYKPASTHNYITRGLARFRRRRSDQQKEDRPSSAVSSGHTPSDVAVCNEVNAQSVDILAEELAVRAQIGAVPIVRFVQHTEAREDSISTSLHKPSMRRLSNPPAAVEEVSYRPEVQAHPSELLASNLLKAQRVPEFSKVCLEHRRQRDKFLQWDCERRAELISSAASCMRQVYQAFDKETTALAETPLMYFKHAATLSRVEDLHIAAESNLRTTQASEIRNTATALRHMEAYCRGESTNGAPHHRTVSDQDRNELVKMRRLRDNMGNRHQSAVNVLRGEQSVRLSARMQRHEKVLEQLETGHQQSLQKCQRSLDSALRLWAQQSRYCKEVLQRWWEIETRLCLKEHAHLVPLSADLPLPLPTLTLSAGGEQPDSL
ncbi:hypothetical protein ANO11243_083940 [Dothideomycetidae sp. 11243]|nr:hypothetical protein ANO11243_083940 [fungal sp. No.11243]